MPSPSSGQRATTHVPPLVPLDLLESPRMCPVPPAQADWHQCTNTCHIPGWSVGVSSRPGHGADVWSNTHLDVAVKIFLDELDI